MWVFTFMIRIVVPRTADLWRLGLHKSVPRSLNVVYTYIYIYIILYVYIYIYMCVYVYI